MLPFVQPGCRTFASLCSADVYIFLRAEVATVRKRPDEQKVARRLVSLFAKALAQQRRVIRQRTDNRSFQDPVGRSGARLRCAVSRPC